MMGDDGEYNLRKTSKNDALFIAAARTALPELLDEVSRLTAELAAMKRERDVAVKDLATAKCCDTCKHQNTVYCARRSKWMINCYEWRGVVTAEGETE
jgi:hypothetical protein